MPNELHNTLTMILAGGQGSRLYPLTRNQAKPAVPFGGMYRIIDFTLSNLVVVQGCVIANARVEHSVISAGVHIDSGAQVTDSVLLEGVKVGANAQLHRVIADEGVVIPPGTQIGIDTEADRRRFTVTDGGVVAISKGLPIE